MRYALILLLLATGCVRQSTYDALKAECAADRQRLEFSLSEEQAKVEALSREKEALELRLAELTNEKANLLKDQSKLEGSIAEMQQALMELDRRKREAEARVAEFKSLIERFKPLMDAGRLRVKIVDGRMVVELATDVLFESGKADLSDDGVEAITEVTGLLVGIPDRRFQIEGHTDNVPIKTSRFPSNWELAAARAITVVTTMVGAGMPPDRVSGASYGEFKPTAPNDTDEGKARNRRIEIVVVPDLSTLPGFEELKKLGGGQTTH